MPLWYQLVVAGLLGAVLASFMNVVAYRMHTNASINGRSRCFSCGHTLTWYELIPIVSYCLQTGRCRSCRAHIAWRDVLVEVFTAAVFIYLYITSMTIIYFFLAAALALVMLGIILYDVEHMIIPNEFVLVIVGIVTTILGLQWYQGLILVPLWVHLLSALGSFAVYAGLWLVSSGRWIGLGDAKLALPLGALLSPTAAFSMIVLSFWVGAIIALSLLTVGFVRRYWRNRAYARTGVANQVGYLTMKSEIPFAPFLIIAFSLAYFLEADVLSLFSYALV